MSANSMVALAGSAIGAAISAMIGPVITFAGRGRTLSRTPPSLLLSGAPAQNTAEQFVAKSYDVALPGVSGCALDL